MPMLRCDTLRNPNKNNFSHYANETRSKNEFSLAFETQNGSSNPFRISRKKTKDEIVVGLLSLGELEEESPS